MIIQLFFLIHFIQIVKNFIKKSPTRRKGEVLKIYCNFANEFKSFNFTVLCDALKHRSELSKGEPLEFYLWFAYEFCLFTITCQAKHRSELSNGE
ncbi:hypothetical protein HMPREF9554_00049 [Treponema phagedenis F0421]|nr:hypothetical protein HMPREF9554_00049 [Treponema phagedenis F0421]